MTSMLPPLESNHINHLYKGLLRRVLSFGERTEPRGEKTLEIRPLVFRLSRPANRLVTLPDRKLNPAFALIEAFQLVSCTTDGDQQLRFNANIKNWLGEDGQIEAAYGILIRDQLPKMLELLKRDPDTRQAVMTVYDGKGHFRPMLNVPCTCTFQFFVREGAVEMVTYMRSNDLWWGLPYDVFQFTALQELVASVLELPMGAYTHIAGSGHIYARHYDEAREVGFSELTVDDLEDQDPLFGHLPYEALLGGVEDVLNVERRVADGEIAKDDARSLLDPPFDRHLNTLLERQRLDR